MFKMGCSMAKRILAIDGKSSGGSSGQDYASAQSSSSKKSKDKPASSGGAAAGSGQEGGGGGKTRASGDELNDFSKLEDDPRIPLNVRQIFKITKSWKAIARTMSKTGTAMFLNLFEQNQDLFYLFDRFQHLKGKELHESMELREHAATVMSTLDHSINSLSDYDNFVAYLHSIGKLHRKVPGFKRDHFWKIEQPFLKAVKQTLDERCNETIEEIYKIAIKLIIETIADGYGDENQPGDNSNGGWPQSGNGNGGSAGRGGRDNEQQQQNGSEKGTGTSSGAQGGSGCGDGSSAKGNTNSTIRNDNSGFARKNRAGGSSSSGPDDRCPAAACADGCHEFGQGASSLCGNIDTTERPPLIDGQITGKDAGGEQKQQQQQLQLAANESSPSELQRGGAEATLVALRNLLAIMVANQRQSEKATQHNQARAPTITNTINTSRRPAAGFGAAASCGLINCDEHSGATGCGAAATTAKLHVDPIIVSGHEGGRRKLRADEKCYSASDICSSSSSRAHSIPIHSATSQPCLLLMNSNDKVDARERTAHNNNSSTNLGDLIYGNAIKISGASDGLGTNCKANKPAIGDQFPSKQACSAIQKQLLPQQQPKCNGIGSPEKKVHCSKNNAQISSSASFYSCTNCLSNAQLESNKLDCLTLMGGISQSMTLSSSQSAATANTATYFADCSECPYDKSATQLSSKLSGTFRLETREDAGRLQDSNMAAKRKPTKMRAGGCRTWISPSVWSQTKQSSLSLANRKRMKSANNSNNNPAREIIQRSTCTENNTATTKKLSPTDRVKSNKFVLTSNPEDLCELIKMLMLTVASRKGACGSQIDGCLDHTIVH